MVTSAAAPVCQDAVGDTLRERILDAAEASFLARGFHATTMDVIAREVRCSKKTLYKLFASKEDLFSLLLVRVRLDVERIRVDQDWEPERVLREFLIAMARVMLRHQTVALARIGIAESSRAAIRTPELNGSSSMTGQFRLEDYLMKLQLGGGYDFGLPLEASRMLVGMALGAFHHEVLTGLRAQVPEAELYGRIDRAVRIFLRGSRTEVTGVWSAPLAVDGSGEMN